MILYSLGRNGLPFQSQDDYYALSHFNVCYKHLWPARLCKHELRCLCTMWHFVGTKHFDLFWARFSNLITVPDCHVSFFVLEGKIEQQISNFGEKIKRPRGPRFSKQQCRKLRQTPYFMHKLFQK